MVPSLNSYLGSSSALTFGPCLSQSSELLLLIMAQDGQHMVTSRPLVLLSKIMAKSTLYNEKGFGHCFI